MRRTERPADGVIDEGTARRSGFGHNVERSADH
jgi:hypothetical protein